MKNKILGFLIFRSFRGCRVTGFQVVVFVRFSGFTKKRSFLVFECGHVNAFQVVLVVDFTPWLQSGRFASGIHDKKMYEYSMKAIPTDPAEYKKAVRRVKAKVSRWPSAYASGMVVSDYKRAMASKGMKPYTTSIPKSKTDLSRWFKEKWVNIKTGKPCGHTGTKKTYPTCRPSRKVSSSTPRTAGSLTAAQKRRMIAIKQRAKKRTASYARVYYA